MNNSLAIIGGTGLPSVDDWVNTSMRPLETQYGEPSATPQIGELNGRQIVFLPRHGAQHSVPPHRINYRANIDALTQLGVKNIIAISAVGGISLDAAPQSIVVPDQLIDYTWGREHTFFDGDPVTHIDFTQPYASGLREELLAAARSTGTHCVDGGTYGATQGPRLETAAEIDRLERDGCTIVGMTGMPEASLAREREMDYACCALVVNWAAGRGESEIGMDEILNNVEQSRKKLHSIIGALISATP
ncbi:MAG: S-methyl-5'-thioinosine phosphorylase [Pseudomonadota bacterium]